MSNILKTVGSSLLSFRWVAVLFVLSLVLFLIGIFGLPMFQAFASGTFSSALMLFIYLFVVEKVVGVVDDVKEIVQNQNVAYAIYLLGIAILVLGGYLAAFAVFFTLKG